MLWNFPEFKETNNQLLLDFFTFEPSYNQVTNAWTELESMNILHDQTWASLSTSYTVIKAGFIFTTLAHLTLTLYL